MEMQDRVGRMADTAIAIGELGGLGLTGPVGVAD